MQSLSGLTACMCSRMASAVLAGGVDSLGTGFALVGAAGLLSGGCCGCLLKLPLGRWMRSSMSGAIGAGGGGDFFILLHEVCKSLPPCSLELWRHVLHKRILSLRTLKSTSMPVFYGCLPSPWLSAVI